MKHIVVSGVNLRKGGTLTVLCECLSYLSSCSGYKVTALVHDKNLCLFPSIEYIEIPWSAKSWIKRLWCEYVTMHHISRQLQPVDLWLSLHDTTPNVIAKRQAVYCHTPFPFMKHNRRDWIMNYKIALFSLFTKYAYRYNVRKNNYLIVQQEWMRISLGKLVRFPISKIIVAPPAFAPFPIPDKASKNDEIVFLYPSYADTHKNFETLCEATALLEKKIGAGRFRTVITISGSENKYANWLYKKYKGVRSIEFRGFMAKEQLIEFYGEASCLVFTSRAETWGLPISEFKVTEKPMILSDLPYSHNTAAGAKNVAFYPVDDAKTLSERMFEIVNGDLSNFVSVKDTALVAPSAYSWEELFKLLLVD